jgi:hypothetical protein
VTEAVQPAPTGPAIPLRLRLVRWTASLHMIAMAAQAALALSFLAGVGEAYAYHGMNGLVVLGLGGLQALAAIANRPARTGRWLTLAAVVLAALEGLQVYLGRAVQTEAHVLLALVIWSLGIFFMVKVWMPAWAEAAR